MTETLIGDVSDTAYWMAHYRDVETKRSDALFHDPLASRLAGERGGKIAKAMPQSYLTGWAIVMRTCIIDDFIRLAIDEGADTILNLGAGLDTRPHRMTLPASLTWIEADYPHVIDYKEQRLAGEIPACRLTRVRCDLSDGSARRRLLTDADSQAKKLLILTEGVVPYLTLDDVAALAGDLRKLRHAKYWLVDYFSPTLLKYRRRQIGDRMRNAPFRFAPADWFGFFADHGWQLREVRYLLDEADLRKRQPKLPVLPALVTTVRRLFMSKRQRDISRKFAGFSLLEPDAAVQQ